VGRRRAARADALAGQSGLYGNRASLSGVKVTVPTRRSLKLGLAGLSPQKTHVLGFSHECSSQMSHRSQKWLSNRNEYWRSLPHPGHLWRALILTLV
jgi:hypothetical protein